MDSLQPDLLFCLLPKGLCGRSKLAKGNSVKFFNMTTSLFVSSSSFIVLNVVVLFFLSLHWRHSPIELYSLISSQKHFSKSNAFFSQAHFQKLYFMDISTVLDELSQEKEKFWKKNKFNYTKKSCITVLQECVKLFEFSNKQFGGLLFIYLKKVEFWVQNLEALRFLPFKSFAFLQF